MKRETNLKFITRLMEGAGSAPMMQAFIISALRDYSDRILADEKAGTPDNGVISRTVWRECAAEAAQELDKRFA